ncbi:MAG TPA: hypothetical protein VF454_00080 [Gemmatimonadales bacterium]
MRRVLVPVLVAFAGSCIFFIDDWSLGQILFWSALATPALLYAAVLLWPDRTRWAARAVAGFVALAYLAYFIDEVFIRKAPVGVGAPSGSTTPWNAYLGLTIIGVPCLLYAVRGRSGSIADPRQATPSVSGSDLPPTDRLDSGNTNAF